LLHPATTNNLAEFLTETAVGTTTIPLNLFTNLCVKRFPKHSFLESILEILQQFEIKLESHEEYFYLIMGDCSKYSINCVRCKKRITACGLIVETLFYAPIAMLHHLGMIANFEVIDESGLIAIPLLFTGCDSFSRSKKSYEESVGNNIDDELAPKCLNSELSSIDQQFCLCEAIKVDAFQSEGNGETISSTLSLIKVLFEDLQLGFELHQQFQTKTHAKVDLNATKFLLLNQTSTTPGGCRFDYQLLKKDGIDPIKKEAFKMLEAFCICGYLEFYKNILCILVFTHQRVYGKESLVPTQTLKMFKQLDNEMVIDHLKRHFKPTCPLSFGHLFSINVEMTVHCT
jgi:hypothetical protein